MTSLRRHAPTACIRGWPAATRRPKKPLRRGLKRMAVSVGRYSALRSRALRKLRRLLPREPAGELAVRHRERKWAVRFTTSLCVMFLVGLASCQQRTPPPGAETSAPSGPPAAGKDSPADAADKAAADKASAAK